MNDKNKPLMLIGKPVLIGIILVLASVTIWVITKAISNGEKPKSVNNTKPAGAHVRESKSEVEQAEIQIKLRNVCYPEKDPGVKYLNDYWRRRERTVTIPVNRAALILIDVWDTRNKRLKKVPVQDRIIKTKMAPLLKAAREVDMVVIYAVHREIGWDGVNREPASGTRRNTSAGRDKLPEWIANAKEQIDPMLSPSVEFLYRVGEYAQFARNDCPLYMPLTQVLGIHPDLLPLKRDREYIESSFREVYQILRKNRILHLLYAGGATNQCIVERPVGMRKMSYVGYNVIILRDATFGTELPDTWDTLEVTKAAVLDIEINNGFSALSTDLLAELKRIAKNSGVGDNTP